LILFEFIFVLEGFCIDFLKKRGDSVLEEEYGVEALAQGTSLERGVNTNVV
jgi:hypothetical protein